MAIKNLKDPKAPSGPVKVGQSLGGTRDFQFIVHIDRDLCIGAGTCVALAPKAFVCDKDGKAVILETADEETEEMILEAARSCPVAAIILTRPMGASKGKKENGEKIFPR